jgi:NAD(P)H-hydrate epimerase
MTAIVLNRHWTREVDRLAVEEYGMSSLVLMENAGRSVADVMQELGVGSEVLICCGKGNNGGDGLVLARHLDLRGVMVRVLAWAAPEGLSPDAASNLRILQAAGLNVLCAEHDQDDSALAPLDAALDDALPRADWVVDALLGTGVQGAPRPPLDGVIRRLNAARRPILSVDVPSGLDCDSGEAAQTTVRAAHTCTFVSAKPGLLMPEAFPFVGKLHVLGIGAPRALLLRVGQLAEADCATEDQSAKGDEFGA